MGSRQFLKEIRTIQRLSIIMYLKEMSFIRFHRNRTVCFFTGLMIMGHSKKITTAILTAKS